MVGDWVRVTIEGRKYPAVVNSINHFTEVIGVSYLASKGDFEDGDGYDEIEPIQLTEEILNTNGFYYERNIGFVFDDGDGAQVVYDSWNHVLKIVRNYEVVLKLETFSDMHVHEMQHALRLCHVNKEITIKR